MTVSSAVPVRGCRFRNRTKNHNMNIPPQIEVTITTKDRSKTITFHVNTAEEKAECERLAIGAKRVDLYTQVDGSGRQFEVVYVDGAKIWERELRNL